MSKISYLIVLFLTISLINSQNFYRKVIHNTDPQAKCLDGSPGSLYIHEGTQKDKFLIYFLGGGFCGLPTLADTLESCYQRSMTDLGSSAHLADTLSNMEGILALDDSLYRNWTKVIFNYCDGSLHQGDNEVPIEYKGTKLYFRGSRIVRSHFKWLTNQYNFDKASKIMITGGSAGAVGSFLWGNYVLSIVKNQSAVYNIPDSGIFINDLTYKSNLPLIQLAISTLMTLAHKTQQTPIPQCNALYKGQQWKCIFNEINYSFLKGKYLYINSQYDWWGIALIKQIKCLTGGSSGYTLKNCSSDQIQAIQDYRAKYLNLISKMRSSQTSIWSIACSKHVYAPYTGFYDVQVQRIPKKTGLNVKDAIQQFVFDDKINWTVDTASWPSNQPCAY